jgi:hypothetical protein
MAWSFSVDQYFSTVYTQATTALLDLGMERQSQAAGASCPAESFVAEVASGEEIIHPFHAF